MMKLYMAFQKEGISRNSAEANQRLDVLQREWGITMFYEQREAIRLKYGLN
jgi:hypothetical protein